MDRKYTIIGLLLLGSALLMLFLQNQQLKRSRPDRIEPQEQVWEEPPSQRDSAIGDSVESEEAKEGFIVSGSEPSMDPLVEAQDDRIELTERTPEETYVIENDYISILFTSRGGAIKQVALKQYPAAQGETLPYIFNEGAKYPALSISRASDDGVIEEYDPDYSLVRLEGNAIEFSRETFPGIELLRHYSISNETEEAAPYIIEHVTKIINRTPSAFKVNRLFVNVGTAPETESDPNNFLLNLAYFDGDDFDYISLNKFKGGGFLGFFKRDPVSKIRKPVPAVWAAAKNQFFTSIVTPEIPGVGVLARPVELSSNPDAVSQREGITGSIEFELENVKPQSERALRIQYYVGPKEYSRLSRLEQNQDLVMQFGWFGIIGKTMLYMLLHLHGMVGNYGVAIILMTIFIRLLLWPLTAKAAQSSKKMQKLQGPLQELREKYKDNQEKLNREMMKLWKEHGVNPFAGCFPIVIQLPIFISFFYMLRSASELRFEGFLWVRDLSLPDTIATIGGFPFNPLPLVMTVSMYYQMRMTPMNVDPAQQKIFRMMPFIFLFICYQFSSGLVLYWTMSNFFSILQQYLTNRKKDPEEVTPAAVAKSFKAGRKKPKKKRRR